MPFGLKNAGATYQWLMKKIFYPMLGKTIEVYIDDILVKSKKQEDHCADLQQAFDLLQHFGLKLNLAKCAFRVSVGKFLGFLVTGRGIEINSAQIKALQELPYSQSKKDVQHLTGKVAALAHFIS